MAWRWWNWRRASASRPFNPKPGWLCSGKGRCPPVPRSRSFAMKTRFAPSLSALLALSAAWAHAPAPAQSPQGAVAGRATAHTEASAHGVIARAPLLLPPTASGASPYLGPLKAAPATAHAKVPVVVFLHGSSGLRLEAIAQWQQRLGSLGISSPAPGAFALPEPLTHQSPVGKE